MKSIQTEILVIGGGATGTGLARDFAMRGFQTILVEKSDLSSGTTGRYHGLLHSGGRYVVKDPLAAVECITENRILRRILPHCIEDTGGYFVLAPGDDPNYAASFLDGCQDAGIPVEEIPISKMLQNEPLLNPAISRCFRVPDGAADSFLASESNAASATAYGARILTYHQVVELVREQDKVRGVRCKDLVNDEEIAIWADFTVNASGAWAGQLAQTIGLGIHIIGGKGTMIAVNHRIVNTVINRCKMPSDGDILVPAHTVAVMGTTDIPIEDPDHYAIEPWEINLLLDEGDKLIPGFSRMRMLRAWAGVRPLYKETGVSDTRDVSRAFVLLDHATRDGIQGLVTITSGKWTTYRKMAEVTADLVCQKLGVKRPGRTHLETVPDTRTSTKYHFLGSRLAKVEKEHLFDNLVCECELATKADVLHAIIDNQARSIDDIRREVRLGMGPCQGAFCSYRAAGLLQQYAEPTQLPKTVTGSTGESPAPARSALRDFLNERWKGLRPILWGQQLRQERLAEMIYLNNFNLHHLPADPSSRLAPVDYNTPAPTEKESPGQQSATTMSSKEPPGKQIRPMHADAIVIGGGLSGLTTAWQLASAGRRVRLITTGWGATHWANGCIDVLGYLPENPTQPVHSPAAVLEEFIHHHPDHPYALSGIEKLTQALADLQELATDAGYPMEGSLERNWLLPTAAGAARPTCLAPATQTPGELTQAGEMLLVGFDGYPDFQPHFAAANLASQGYAARAVKIALPTNPGRQAITNRLLATWFEDPRVSAEIVRLLKPHLAGCARVGFPAVLGYTKAHQIQSDLSRQLGTPVFEVPTLPPSIPGIRLHRILLEAITNHGGQVFANMEAQIASITDRQVVTVWTEAAARTVPHRADVYILASGGILGGGLVAHPTGEVQETIFNLPLHAPSQRLLWLRADFFDPQGHPLYHAGIQVNNRFQPISDDGEVLLENLFIAGATLAGARPMRELSREGISLVSGYALGKQLS